MRTAVLLLALASSAAANCATDADCTVGTDPKCVIESPFYSSCVDCDAKSFSSSCLYMSSTFLAAAEQTCGQMCNGRCPTGEDVECSNSTTGATCVQTASADYCVDCSDQVRIVLG